MLAAFGVPHLRTLQKLREFVPFAILIGVAKLHRLLLQVRQYNKLRSKFLYGLGRCSRIN